MKREVFLKLILASCVPLLLTACGPALFADRSGEYVTVSYDNDKSCFTVDQFRAVADKECKKIGKSVNPVPNSVSNSTNMFCSSTGVWRTVFNCGDDLNVGQSPEPSRLELRAMQTRKFNKPPQAVIASINEIYKDKNQQCYNVRVPTYACPSGILMTKPIKGKLTTYCANSDGTPAQDQKMVKRSDLSPDGFCIGGGYITSFSIDTNHPESTSTIVRMRISNYKPGSRSEAQLTNPEAYSKAFKEIADGLFIDAVALTPAEMQ